MTKTIKSFTSNAHYFLTIDDETGECKDCRCPDHAKWCPNRAGGCKHMKAYAEAYQRALDFQALMAQYDVRLNGQERSRYLNYCLQIGA